MAEPFGLDRRIDQYMGKKPIGLYRWDLECLIDVLDFALNNPKEYPDHDSSNYAYPIDTGWCFYDQYE